MDVRSSALLKTRVADPDEVDPDLYPTLEKQPGSVLMKFTVNCCSKIKLDIKVSIIENKNYKKNFDDRETHQTKTTKRVATLENIYNVISIFRFKMKICCEFIIILISLTGKEKNFTLNKS